MRIVCTGMLIMLLTLVSGATIAVSGNSISDDYIIVDKDKIIKPGESPRTFRDYYNTWNVVEVTEDAIFLEREKMNGEIDKVSIERSRRPYLEVGDMVRYDKKRNRLRKTLDK